MKARTIAIRGRYNSDGSTSQQIEFRKDDVTNTLTTVLKDNLILEMRVDQMTALTVNDFFCGAGGMGLGFKNAGFRLGGAWDFDKYAVESYGHNVSPKVKQADITQMTAADVPHSDVWTFGFPCQDISNAGNQAGMIKGVTRSGLFYEVMRLLDESKDKPKIILAENVKAVKKYLPEIEKEYAAQGYKMYTVLYNSKYWGVPQNRERYFMIGVHESIVKEFVFTEQPTGIKTKLLDVLEVHVDENFYLKDEQIARFTRSLESFNPMLGDIEVIGTTKSDTAMGTNSSSWVHTSNKRIGTLSARDYKQPKQILVNQATKKGYDEAFTGDSINISHPNSKTRRGSVGKQVAQALLTGQEQVVVEPRIRKLTPREYARLQGFPDTYEQVVSNTQFYKQMGNAVTVNVAQAIAERIKEFLQVSSDLTDQENKPIPMNGEHPAHDYFGTVVDYKDEYWVTPKEEIVHPLNIDLYFRDVLKAELVRTGD
ncbi:MAG: DNA (cytosine-5-)-methyltransferase [Planococcaceae bacterium]|nr:DNA (cytosine-5-)-methyltransferase [Planococcaceae bacterium]